MSASPPPLLGPVASSERVQYLDVLRGFALYGVLVANIIWMACDMVLTPAAARQLPTHSVDRVVKYLVVFFIDGKFITLFSFLFAVGFTIQMQRAVQRGGNAVSTYARRVAVLMLIGVAHIVFIWFGDILLIYGFLGFALLAMRNWRPGRAMLVLACLLILLTRPAFLTVQKVIAQGHSAHAAAAHPTDETQLQTLAAFRGGYATVARKNVSIYWRDLFPTGLIAALLGQALGRFLLGLYVGKRGYVQQIDRYVTAIRRAMPWLLLMGVVGNGVSVAFEWAQTVRGVSANSFWLILLRPILDAGVVSLAAFYAGGIAILLQSARWGPTLTRLAAVGRMALTNYLTQSLVYLFVLTGAGWGLIGHIGATVCVAITIVLFALQIVFSAWWLRHYHFGPAEWLWRSLTYGRIQRMRRDELASVSF